MKKEKLFEVLKNRYPELREDSVFFCFTGESRESLTIYQDDMLYEFEYDSGHFVMFRKSRIENGCIAEEIEVVFMSDYDFLDDFSEECVAIIAKINADKDEEKPETVDVEPAEEVENCGTILKSETLFDSDFEEWCEAVEAAEDFRIACQFGYHESDSKLPQQHLVFEGYEEYENALSSFDEIAAMVGCENFTDEECARELSYLLYADVDLANEYLHELHPYDQEVLYVFYMASKMGKNSWTFSDDAPLALCCDGKKIFFAYSEEEKG